MVVAGIIGAGAIVAGLTFIKMNYPGQ